VFGTCQLALAGKQTAAVPVETASAEAADCVCGGSAALAGQHFVGGAVAQQTIEWLPCVHRLHTLKSHFLEAGDSKASGEERAGDVHPQLPHSLDGSIDARTHTASLHVPHLSSHRPHITAALAVEHAIRVSTESVAQLVDGKQTAAAVMKRVALVWLDERVVEVVALEADLAQCLANGYVSFHFAV